MKCVILYIQREWSCRKPAVGGVGYSAGAGTDGGSASFVGRYRISAGVIP